MQKAHILLVALSLAACLRDKPDTANTASVYTSDSESNAKDDRLSGTNSGSELEAPRLIPAMLNQLNLMSKSPGRVSTENLTAYRNLAGDLIHSMQADLARVGLADSGNFHALADSALTDMGGGAGGMASGPDPSKLGEHVSRMRRLISLYQEAMRSAGDRL
jgi:hypothetical protein